MDEQVDYVAGADLIVKMSDRLKQVKKRKSIDLI